MTKLDKAPAYRWWILIMNMLAYGSCFMTIQCGNAYGAQISEDLGLNPFLLSLTVTACIITFAVFSPLGGKMMTKYGAKKTAMIGLIINIAASALFIIIPQSFIIMMILRLIQGIPAGIIQAPGVAGTPLWFPIKQKGLASGILNGILGVGFSIAVLGAALTNGMGMSWSKGLGLFNVVVLTIILILYALTVKDIDTMYPGASSIDELLPKETDGSKAVYADPNPQSQTMAEARADKRFWACVFFAFGNGWLLYGIPAFLNTFLATDIGVTGTTITLVTSSTFFITLISSPLGGLVSDNIFKGRRYQVLMIGAAMTGFGILFLLFAGKSVGFIALLLLIAYAGVAFVCGTYWVTPGEIVNPKIAGESTSFCMIFANLGGIIVSPLMAATITATGHSYIALISCVVIGLLSVLAGWIIKH